MVTFGMTEAFAKFSSYWWLAMVSLKIELREFAPIVASFHDPV